MTCSACRNFHATNFKKLKADYIDTGKVRLVLREFPTPPVDRSKAAFMLARCFPKDRYFAVVDALFRTQREWVLADDAHAALKKIAKQMGMTDDDFEACLSNGAELERIDKVIEIGDERYGVSSTPSFVINGKTYQNMPYEQFQAILDPLVSQ
jgi:protein-disulfide isomerase